MSKKFNIKEKEKYSWDYITIDKYYKIAEICDDDSLDPNIKSAKLVAVIEDKSEDEIFSMNLVELSYLINKLKFIGDFKFETMNLLTKTITINGRAFSIISPSKITVAQYVDYQNIVKLDYSKNIEKLLSIFIVPKGYSYNEGYDIVELQNFLKYNLAFKFSQSLLNFILIKYIISTYSSLIYLIRKMPKEEREQMKKILTTGK